MPFLTSKIISRIPSTPLLRSRIATTITPSRRFHAASPSLFHTSPARAALSESDHDKDHPDRDKHIDSHKQDALNKQKEGKGHWKKELSSNSEQAIKADRDEIGATDEHIKELQESAKKLAEESKKED